MSGRGWAMRWLARPLIGRVLAVIWCSVLTPFVYFDPLALCLLFDEIFF